MQALRIHPPFSICLRFCALGFGSVGLAFTAERVVKALAKTSELALDAFQSPLRTIGMVGIIVALISGGLYLMFRGCAVTIDAKNIRGRSYWGSRQTIALADIEIVMQVDLRGISVLQVSSCADQEIWVYLLGVDAPKIHDQLRQLAGPDHALTRAFRNLA